MRFWFQVWWRQDDGRSYAYQVGHGSLAEAQKAHAGLVDRMSKADPSVVACGLSRVYCPQDGPWPRPGEQGKVPVVVRAEENDGGEVAA